MKYLKKNDTIQLFVSGRLSIMGEHSDWAGRHRIMNSEIVPGEAIVTGIEQGIYATVKKDVCLSIQSDIDLYKGEAFSCAMNERDLDKVAKEGGFFSYVAGVAAFVLENYKVGGIHVTINKMDLPIKMGLSSSAAICVLITRAFNQLYKLNLSTQGEMHVAFMGEQRTPSRCGRLDQACAFGVKPVKMIFDGYEVKTEPILLKVPLYFVVANLNKGKNTVKILNDLNKSFPFAESEKDRDVQEALGIDNRRYIGRAIEAMEKGDASQLGNVMNEFQLNFDRKVAPASFEQLKAPILHSVLEDEKIKGLTYGMKGVGSQGDGTVQLLARDRQCQDKLIQYLENERKMTAFRLSIKPERVVNKAIVPVAGLATRLFPASKGIKKAFMPVPDKGGLLKPAIMIILEELYYAGIRKVCLVISEGEQKTYEDFFRLPSAELMNKLSEQNRKYAMLMDEIGQCVTYVCQKQKKGFGHAVYLCRDFANEDPVILLLGDTLYRSDIGDSCARQLIKLYEKNGGTIVSLQPISIENVSQFGMAHGIWEDEDQTLLLIDKLVEKPSKEYASEELRVRTKKGKDNYYAIFGQYILSKEVFEVLQQRVEYSNNDEGEIQLTEVLSEVNQKYGVMGLIPKGKSFDIGIPSAYFDTFQNYMKFK